MIVELPAVEGDDAGGLLATMLQGVQAERSVGGGVGSPVDAEQRTLLVKLVEVVVGAFGGAWHGGGISGVRRPRIKDISLRRVWGRWRRVWGGPRRGFWPGAGGAPRDPPGAHPRPTAPPP